MCLQEPAPIFGQQFFATAARKWNSVRSQPGTRAGYPDCVMMCLPEACLTIPIHDACCAGGGRGISTNRARALKTRAVMVRLQSAVSESPTQCSVQHFSAGGGELTRRHLTSHCQGCGLSSAEWFCTIMMSVPQVLGCYSVRGAEMHFEGLLSRTGLSSLVRAQI